jgi:hypothetical protein
MARPDGHYDPSGGKNLASVTGGKPVAGRAGRTPGSAS